MKNLFITIFAILTFANVQGQQFETAIITSKEHVYDVKRNLKSKIIRAIPIGGANWMGNNFNVMVKTYSYTIENGVVKITDLQDNDFYTYSSAEVDAFFKQMGNSILTTESYHGEYLKIITAVLTLQTQGMFNNDSLTIYTEK
jgi:hypothetical protein